ncbi:MAG TPA: S41 family peptidase [Candidatus Acidoferrales bacterium]|nr:S41 family peptidase [Candidatus Acidoferrales bacterium]
MKNNLVRHISFALICVALVATGVAAKPAQLLRHPDYHNGKITFSYLGDIWVVNEDATNPQRLTVHTARDVFPRFSPDGKWIAFSSNRYGNMDVFVIPAEGGEARQLTYNSAGDSVVGWSRDSKKVIFSSARGLMYPGTPNLYEVALDGGLEQPLPTDWGYWGSYSPDGKKFAFNRHPMVWWRKHYRGSYSADLWVMDGAKYKKILDAELPDEQKPNNFWPMYGNGEIYFVSDRDVVSRPGTKEVMQSANNLWKISENGGKPVQVTHHKSGSLFFPSMSSDGKVIVYEQDFGLWKLETATGKTTEIKVNIISDWKENNFEVLTVNGETNGYHLSPSTKRAVVSAHGELFTIATDRGDVTRVTNSYTRDGNAQWSPDGKRLAWVSDQSGREEVWVADVEGKNAKKLSDADSEKSAIRWLPDAKSLVYTASDHKMYLVEVDTGKTQTLATNDASNIQGPDVSPDGKWIAYTKADPDMRPHVFIVSTAGGTEHRLSDDLLFSSSNARWTPDGKKIIFLGGYLQGGSATIRDNVAALYAVSLTKDEKDPMSRDIDDEEAAVAAERAEAAARRPAGAGGAAQAEVKIDWDGLERRIRQVTRINDSISTAVAAPDSRSYVFVAQTEEDGRNIAVLYSIQSTGEQMRRVTTSQPPAEGEGGGFGGFGGGIGSLQFSKDGRTLFFLEGNRINSIGIGGGTGGGATGAASSAPTGGGAASGGGGRQRINFTVRVEVDNREERKQVFNEAWRVMKNRFYDANMHGADWVKAKATYEPLLADVADREELQSVISQMIGELNASHTGIGGGGAPDRDAIQTRYPGFELVADTSGYYKVSYVYKNGPADNDYVKIKTGDYILAIEGIPVKSGENYWKHYNLAPGRKLDFTVNSKPTTDGAWTTKVVPVNGGAYGTLQYEKWVEDRRQMVEKLSGGEVGYLHIRQMNAQALRKFERDLADNHFKKALIIDQRFNPGGGIDQELLQILQQRQYQYTRGRDSVFVTRPQRGFLGPIVVMQNERSTSDAEVFPDGIRTLKLGKVVGINTYGAVIGTGSYTLLDGSAIRTPGSGLWNISGQNLENYGVPPDVYVDNSPADFITGRDAQLAKAVEVLKDEIKKTAQKNILGAGK